MEKATEVEMEKIGPAEEREDENASLYTKQERKEAKDEKENEYTALVKTPEDIYTLSTIPTSSPKYHEDVNGTIRLYRRVSAILLLLCVLLLAVVLALAIKLSEVQTKQACPNVELTTVAEVCTRQKCAILYRHEANEHLCSECGKGWLKFENSCYFLSRHRLTWQESREQCQKWGGDLAVITNQQVQTFLTEKGPLLYWIGLHDVGIQQWTWINNTALTQSYWNQQPEAGHCALLRGWKQPQNNWYSNPCVVNSHYICQRG